MVLLDRTFVFDLFTEEPDAIAAIDEFDWRDASISLVTVTEVRRGLPDSKIEEFDELMRRLGVRQYNFDEGRRAVDLHKEVTGIDPVDAMVAATALEADEPILTGNPDAFEGTGVDVVTY